ncbi:YecA family protein [Modestobacter sp. I12A-02662]|uniref:YecA family protein n=1 Tax=Modestobacter sp. I12A-02662 TaxID=1730496 RepID=UPI0034DE022D
MTATVLDVIDNFLTGEGATEVHRIPGRNLYELGREARRLADARTPAQVEPGAIYLGGWPSANFWAVSGDLILSTLLYADSVVVKDPVTDWFSSSQYRVPHVMPTRPGYLDPEAGKPAVGQTRAFLRSVLPSLLALRPLVESGAIIFTSSHDFNLAASGQIELMTESLMANLVRDVAQYTMDFSPEEIAVEDNVRGMFVAAPGDQEASVVRSLEHGMRHFAREYLLATSVGATYTAPFRHERYLCESGLGRSLSPSERVTRALMTTELPILTGLTPEIVAKVRRDDAYEDFRAQLHNIYAGLPVGAPHDEVERFLEDQERALLAGPLRRAEQDLSRGALGRLGASLSRATFNIAAGVAMDAAVGTGWLGAGLGAAKTAAEEVVAARASLGPQRVWNALVKHNRKPNQELDGVSVQLGHAQQKPYWGIPGTPGMTVTVTAGATLWDHVPQPGASDESPSGAYREGDYAPCDCGSGRGYRYCCRRLKVDF